MRLLAGMGGRLLVAGPILLLAGVLLFAVLDGRAAGAQGWPEGWLPVRFLGWLARVVSGDWGISAQLGVPVAVLLGSALPATLELVGLAVLFCGALGLAGGLLLFALRRDGGRREGRAALAETAAAALMSVPEMLWALGLLVVFGFALPWAPPGGRLDPGLDWPGGMGFLVVEALLAGEGAVLASALGHMLVPALALGLAFAPPVMRVLGGALAEAWRAPFAGQARRRGLSAAQVLLGEALPLAALPALAALGRQFGLLLGGAAVVEAVCLYPGLGRMLVEAVRAGDVAVVQAAALAFALVAVLAEAAVAGLCRGLNPGGRR